MTAPLDMCHIYDNILLKDYIWRDRGSGNSWDYEICPKYAGKSGNCPLIPGKYTGYGKPVIGFFLPRAFSIARECREFQKFHSEI